MLNVLVFIAAAGLIGQAFIGLTYLVSSIREKERRASVFGGLQFLGMLATAILFFYLQNSGFFRTTAGVGILIAALMIGGIATIVLITKTGPNLKALEGTKGLILGHVKRQDERAIVFARNRSLPPDSEQYKIFYAAHPQLEPWDAARREKGGSLGCPGTIDKPHEKTNVAAAFASLSIPLFLSTPDKFAPQALAMFHGRRVDLNPGLATAIVKGYAGKLGAAKSGITEINPLWVYSHRGEIFHGNWEDWGKEIAVKHRYAVVFATEMSLEMVGTAPHTPTTIESMANYAKGAYIATQVASFITNLGYSATAHHLRHYDFVLVPLAVDAGLGECGRLGYLMTKEFGPRVRLGAVSTDLALVPDSPVDIGVADFCRICKKCALCCPSNSIPMEDPAEVNGTLRWKLNAETCFDYWGKVGTDCNICMRVCPWSHANTLPHKIVRELIMRNRISRRFFFLMDDIFYGKKPKPKTPPKWADFYGTD